MIKYIQILSLAGLLLIHSACENQKKPADEKKVSRILNEQEDTLTHFAYVALAYSKPAIYKYDIAKGNFELLWWNQDDFVIALITDHKTNISFFITARKVGQKGNFPSISKIELYRINPKVSEVDFINDIGNAMQLNAYWNDEGNFELVFTDIDKTISSYINKYLQVYNSFGKLIDDKVETFDLTKTGYPQLLPKKSSTVSESGRFGISETNDSVYLRTAGDKEEKFITVIDDIISEVGWSKDEDFLFFSTSNAESSPEQLKDSQVSGLYVYDINKDSLVSSWFGPGRKDFFTTGDLLIFEDGLGENSYIVIYNFREAEQLNSFTRKGGSGLKNISQKER